MKIVCELIIKTTWSKETLERLHREGEEIRKVLDSRIRRMQRP